MEKQSETEQKSQTLYDTLVTYSESDFYPYHMPGHKRRQDVGDASDLFRLDITEIDGFDNLHQAEGIIRQAQERAAGLYGADESFFLVNGSTCGILAAIHAVTDRGDTILIARNCHKSVYHAAFLQELNLKYIYPEQIEEYDINGAINPEAVQSALEEHPECRAVVITSPTYEGVISNIAEIAKIVHDKGKPLIVDEAHGAHLGLAENIPENAVRQGADLVIHSLHKTLPSMTQTALLHANESYVNRAKLRRYLSIFQSSSPSYVLMAGMDACISYIKENAASDFSNMRLHYQNFIKRMEMCRNINIATPEILDDGKYCFTVWDICKLVISVKKSSISGQTLYNILRDEFHLQMEMAADSYVLAIMTIADKEDAWKRLADALIKIDGTIDGADTTDNIIKTAQNHHKHIEPIMPIARMSIAQALKSFYKNPKVIPLAQAQGEISGGFINLYPPGIPIIVPGEIINEEIIEQIKHSLELGLNVQGISPTETVEII
ncbi:MAG: aminotransferase class V-fold PLP-dependent enzyme [Lachnospiraceae bacterium]|nr:aminotransferase class V-fold PLP-dependent enzyme [Lachnospiraceae bacterium]